MALLKSKITKAIRTGRIEKSTFKKSAAGINGNEK